jgi:hypothetical protein
MRLLSCLTAVATFLCWNGAHCIAQQAPGPATLENLGNAHEARDTDEGGAPDATAVGAKKPAGTLARPKDGVQHPDLDRAWAEYEQTISKAAESIKAAINKQFDAAAAKGDLDAAEKWQAALHNFEKAGEVPVDAEAKTTVSAAFADYKKAKEALAKVYEAVVKSLTMQKNIAEARNVRKELENVQATVDQASNSTGAALAQKRGGTVDVTEGDDAEQKQNDKQRGVVPNTSLTKSLLWRKANKDVVLNGALMVADVDIAMQRKKGQDFAKWFITPRGDLPAQGLVVSRISAGADGMFTCFLENRGTILAFYLKAAQVQQCKMRITVAPWLGGDVYLNGARIGKQVGANGKGSEEMFDLELQAGVNSVVFITEMGFHGGNKAMIRLESEGMMVGY